MTNIIDILAEAESGKEKDDEREAGKIRKTVEIFKTVSEWCMGLLQWIKRETSAS